MLLFVTGNDTAVGKTEVTAKLARALIQDGLRVSAIKPVESGISELAPEDEDGARLARATGQIEPKRALTRLRAPLAPPVAAARENITLNTSAWTPVFAAHAALVDVVLIEGAGGLLSPLTEDSTVLDLMRTHQGKALLVVRDQLGAVNQAAMPLTLLRQAGIDVVSVVFNRFPDADESTKDNMSTFRTLTDHTAVAAHPHEDFDVRVCRQVRAWL